MRRLNISREKSYCWGRFSFYFILPKPLSTHSTWIETTGEMQRREEEEEEGKKNRYKRRSDSFPFGRAYMARQQCRTADC
jgi:hypothetical protein